MTLDLAANLTAWAQEDQGRLMSSGLAALRQRLYEELGVRLPGIRVRLGAEYLLDGGYALLVEEVPAGRGQVNPRGLYASCRPGELKGFGLSAEPGVDPVTGEPLSLLPAEARERRELAHVKLRAGGRIPKVSLAMRKFFGRYQDDEDAFLDRQKPRAMYMKDFDEGLIAHHRMCLRMGQNAFEGREPFLVEETGQEKNFATNLDGPKAVEPVGA